MSVYVGLLRGINVGGHNKLPMADLRAICESAGLEDVQTYIQSGNLVFRYPKQVSTLPKKLGDEIESHFGFRPKMIILTSEYFSEAARKYPFTVADHKLASLMFLDSQPKDAAIERLNEVDHSPDQIEVGHRVVHIYFPNGVSGSRTNLAKIERVLGVNGTARNWRTVQKLISMAS